MENKSEAQMGMSDTDAEAKVLNHTLQVTSLQTPSF
jgi:hypothetical protein